MRRALLALLLVTTACGGGDDGKAAYVDQASAVCSDAVERFDALTTPTSADGFAPYADSVVAILQDTERELSALTPPADDRAELESQVLDPLAELVPEAEQFAAKVKAAGSDQVALLGLLSQRPTGASIDQQFLRDYGLDSCADAVEKAG